MDDFDDPLDLLDDDGDGVIEMCLLDEEKQKGSGGNNNSGCCIVFCALSASAFFSVWGLTKLLV